MWRDLFPPRRRESAARTEVARAADVWERAGRLSAATLQMMTEVEATALKVYGQNGLPTRPGHYRRGPDAEEWEFLAEQVEADLRWALVLERPTGSGWRYATLEDLGQFKGASGDVRAASALLATCRHLKSRMTGREPGNPGDDIDTAIRLGADWRRLQEALEGKEKSRLKLTTPGDEGPEPMLAILEKPAAPAKPKRVRKKKTAGSGGETAR